jgi:hypothetical protein
MKNLSVVNLQPLKFNFTISYYNGIQRKINVKSPHYTLKFFEPVLFGWSGGSPSFFACRFQTQQVGKILPNTKAVHAAVTQ